MTAPSFTYSGNVYTGAAAGTVDFALTSTTGNAIAYLEPSHIHVYKSSNQGSTWTELTRPSQWDFVTNGTVARLVTGIAAGDWVKVQRITPSTSSYVTFQASSLLTADQLNDDTLFNTYLNQERVDQGDQSTLTANTASTNAATALSTANTALSTANAASASAASAVSTANTASTNATAAVATANTASTNASAAVATANTASSNASAAVSTANTAASNASTALSTANTALTNASAAVTTSNNANTTAQAANTTATNAESIANSALSIVAGTVQYVPVANVAAIPASPSNNDAIQIQDSTGIQSFTPLSGLPAGFTGTPQLFVRLQYSSAGSTWQYVGYGANDPDNRYVVQGVTGTANNPSFYFDSDTGIYSPGANELGLSTGGAARLTIDSAGNVSIPGTLGVTGAITGSLTGAASLNVLKAGDTMTGNLTAPALIPSGSTVPTNGVYLPAANNVAISTNGSERATIDSSGRLLVGTSSWSTETTFVVQGFVGGATGEGIIGLAKGGADNPAANGVLGQIRFTDSAGSRGAAIRAESDNNWAAGDTPGRLMFQTTPSGSATPVERARITSDGKVGLGTSNPSKILEVASASSDIALLRRKNPSGGAGLWLSNNSNNGAALVSEGGSGGGFVLYTQSSDVITPRMRIDSSGNAGIGTTTVSTKLHVKQSGSGQGVWIEHPANDTQLRLGIDTSSSTAVINASYSSGGSYYPLAFLTSDLERARIDTSGRLLVGTSSASGEPIAAFQGRSNDATDSGIVAITRSGANPSGSIGELRFATGSDLNKYYAMIIAASDGSTSASSLPGMLRFHTTANGATTPTERMRIDSSGRLLVGTSSARSNFLNTSVSDAKTQIEGTDRNTSSLSLTSNNTGSGNPAILYINKSKGSSIGSNTILSSGDELGGVYFQGNDGSEFVVAAAIDAAVDGTPGANDMPGRLVFSTTADGASSPTERMRITNSGSSLFNKTTTSIGTAGLSIGNNDVGSAKAGCLCVTVDSEDCIYINRLTNDGNLISFRQDGTQEGTISVSGTTVSYNGAHLSRWSQLVGIDPYDKSVRPEILRGTVMSNLDEMCDWTCPTSGDCQDNEQLNKTEISSVDDDPNVAGVFQSWDDDDTWVNDFYLAMTGDFVIRIAAGTTVQRGDLLCSAGDGTARPQGDRYIKDSTIAKVTSTTVSCTHPDGSYCVPCVLMAC